MSVEQRVHEATEGFRPLEPTGIGVTVMVNREVRLSTPSVAVGVSTGPIGVTVNDGNEVIAEVDES